MSVARDDEVVVTPDLAAAAGRQGVHLEPGARVRFTVVSDDAATHRGQGESWPPAWVGSIKAAEPDLATNYRQVLRDEIAGP